MVGGSSPLGGSHARVILLLDPVDPGLRLSVLVSLDGDGAVLDLDHLTAVAPDDLVDRDATLELQNLHDLNDILHVGAAEVHGAAVDVVQDQLHVVALDHRQQEGDHIVALLLLVLPQQFLDERRHRSEDNSVRPQTGVHTNNFDITEFSTDKSVGKYSYH